MCSNAENKIKSLGSSDAACIYSTSSLAGILNKKTWQILHIKRKDWYEQKNKSHSSQFWFYKVGENIRKLLNVYFIAMT